VSLAGVTTLRVTLADAPGELARAQRLLDEFAAANDLPADVLFALNVVLDEITSNIIRYAYADRAGGEIRLRLSAGDGGVEMEFEDDGAPFNPLELPPPDLAAPLATRQVGGLGVHLARRLMNEVVYARVANHNRLILRKSLADRGETEGGHSGS